MSDMLVRIDKREEEKNNIKVENNIN